MWTTRLKQRGFALPSAIFILVILAALGAYAVKTSSSQHLALALDFQGARAYQAARVGVDWGIHKATLTGAACAAATCSQNPLTLPPGELADFVVVVACSCTSYSEGGKTINVFNITSTASLGGGASKAERQLSATVQN